MQLRETFVFSRFQSTHFHCLPSPCPMVHIFITRLVLQCLFYIYHLYNMFIIFQHLYIDCLCHWHLYITFFTYRNHELRPRIQPPTACQPCVHFHHKYILYKLYFTNRHDLNHARKLSLLLQFLYGLIIVYGNSVTKFVQYEINATQMFPFKKLGIKVYRRRPRLRCMYMWCAYKSCVIYRGREQYIRAHSALSFQDGSQDSGPPGEDILPIYIDVSILFILTNNRLWYRFILHRNRPIHTRGFRCIAIVIFLEHQ